MNEYEKALEDVKETWAELKGDVRECFSKYIWVWKAGSKPKRMLKEDVSYIDKIGGDNAKVENRSQSPVLDNPGNPNGDDRPVGLS